MKPFFFILCAALCGCSIPLHTGQKSLYLHGPSDELVAVSVEVADDPDERRDGLMNRTHLEENTGMLFVFEDEAMRSFWMKNTLIPLDIIFFDAQKNIVSMSSMQPCVEDPCDHYSSDYPAQYALEVPEGFLSHHAITDAWTMELP